MQSAKNIKIIHAISSFNQIRTLLTSLRDILSKQ